MPAAGSCAMLGKAILMSSTPPLCGARLGLVSQWGGRTGLKRARWARFYEVTSRPH
jgi:hypothetical protein